MEYQTSYEYTSTTTTYSSDDNVVRSSTTHIQSESQTLIVNAVGANFQKDGQKLGTQDPYMQFTLNLEDKKSFQKTYTAKNGGKTPSWNQSFNLPLQGEPDLFIEVLDKETTADALIGFAAIPINQVVHAQGGSINGLFDLYDVKNNVVGEINLILQAQGFQNSSNQQPPSSPVRFQSYVHEVHQKRCKSLRTKEHVAEAGTAILGGALAIGAGLLGKKLYDDHKKEEQEEKDRAEEEERRRQEFSQREEELKRREEEFGRREQEEQQERERREQEERERREREERERREREERQHQHHKKKSHCNDDDDEDCHHSRKKCVDEWDPVGTYKAGDRVEYHGRTYLCLQGHTSNPTWKPNAASSLWELA
ncbi:uncharacterized protein BX664DRAFT_302005 [Halteromyces radiatus]|uniref:uncharacterized protein n=1 Tax=Halteromyces radiatus TaxID=101107 RepID=UPI00221EE841|nr:uncharacterized protein BX664DRAFT_302005 [Halteromyces radiatus]KAI8081352.1 hypothetical protein BX664DRAFT_302005 [Halteromyces radiatus]